MEKKFSCHECAKKYTRKDNLNYHVKKAHKAPPFKCDVCGRPLLKEKEKHACSDPNGQHACTYEKCGARFKTVQGLTAHNKSTHLCGGIGSKKFLSKKISEMDKKN